MWVKFGFVPNLEKDPFMQGVEELLHMDAECHAEILATAKCGRMLGGSGDVWGVNTAGFPADRSKGRYPVSVDPLHMGA